VNTLGEVLYGSGRWCVLEADCAEVLPMLPPRSVDHVITDPPYGAHVHNLQRRCLTTAHDDGSGIVARDGQYKGAPVIKDLGFASLSVVLRATCGAEFSRLAQRWIIIKSDIEGVLGADDGGSWRADLMAAGARWVRFGFWWKEDGQPQLSGDRPAQPGEGFAIAHADGERLRWNGGGKHARWSHPTAKGDRVHTTQTPLPLWLEIVEDFTDPGDLILDPFCGSGSLGIACVRLGRRYIGMDNGKDAQGKPWAEWAREGIAAEEHGLSRGAARAGQLGLFAV
jgi:site-specific DNA-methyltransferase (adenine-specific)